MARVRIELEREEVYDLCDALSTEAERYGELLLKRMDAPAEVRREWLKKAGSTRELSRRLISECFTSQKVA